MKIRLIDNVKYAGKFLSVRIAGAGAVIFAVVGAFPDVFYALPEEVRGAFPDWVLCVMGVMICVLTIIGRVIQQQCGEGEKDENQVD